MAFGSRTSQTTGMALARLPPISLAARFSVDSSRADHDIAAFGNQSARDGQTNASVASGDECHFSLEQRLKRFSLHPGSSMTEEVVITSPTRIAHYAPFVRLRINDRNSVRVSCSSRKQPSIDEVTAAECCFSTPRIIMHRWRASITTPTPWGSIDF